jgi:hypothetical protein
VLINRAHNEATVINLGGLEERKKIVIIIAMSASETVENLSLKENQQ